MATIRIRLEAESIDDLKRILKGIIEEIEEGNTGVGWTGYDYSVDGELEGVEINKDR